MQRNEKIPMTVATEIVNVIHDFHYTRWDKNLTWLEQTRRDMAQSVILFLSGRAENIYPTEPGVFHPGQKPGEPRILREDTTPESTQTVVLEPGYAPIPALIVEQVSNYGAEHLVPGDFVRAVLENDLTQAIHFADEKSYASLKAIWTFCQRFLPPESWGSSELVESWLTLEGQGEDEDVRER